MAAILNCPVCGKTPRVKHRDRPGEHMVQVICKPLFGQLHESALAYSSYETEAYRDAIQIWNGRVKHYEEAHKNVGT
jgi:hypothetical protein